jgi:hypothetical protein
MAKKVSGGTPESVVVSPVLTLWTVGALGVERGGQWISKCVLYFPLCSFTMSSSRAISHLKSSHL